MNAKLSSFPVKINKTTELRLLRQQLWLRDQQNSPQDQDIAAQVASRDLIQALAATYDLAQTRKAEDVKNNLCRLRAEQAIMDELYHA